MQKATNRSSSFLRITILHYIQLTTESLTYIKYKAVIESYQ